MGRGGHNRRGCFLLVVGRGEVRKMLYGGDRVRCTVCADGSFSQKGKTFLGAVLEADVISLFVVNLHGWSQRLFWAK